MADSFVNDTGLGRIWGKIKEALAGKAPLSHTHTKNQITDFPTSMPASDVYEWAKASSKPSYGISEISGLQSALDEKEVTSNKVTSWSSTTTDAHYPSEKLVKAGLDGKANSSHTHSISQITNLQSTLDGKAPLSHTHTKNQITDFPTSMPASDVYEWAKASSKPSYGISEISGLQSALDGKVTVSDLLSKVYPIGSVYLSVSKTSPASFLGGSWAMISEDCALWTASIHATAGTVIPAGLPNITGEATSQRYPTNRGDVIKNGAFANTVYSSSTGWSDSGSGTRYYISKLSFNASSSNSIYGNSSTVQPQAYKVYAWERII